MALGILRQIELVVRDRVALGGLVPQLLLDGPVGFSAAAGWAAVATGCRRRRSGAATGRSPPMNTSRASDALCQGRWAPPVASETSARTRVSALWISRPGVARLWASAVGVRAVRVLAIIGDRSGIGRIGDQQTAGIAALAVGLDRSEAGAYRRERLTGRARASVRASGLSRQASRMITPTAGSGGSAASTVSTGIVRVCSCAAFSSSASTGIR